METPHAKAASHIKHIEEYCIPEAQSEFGIDPSDECREIVFFVSVAGFSPYRNFNSQRGSVLPAAAESEEANETVLSWLRGGSSPSVVLKKLKRMQQWEWGALTIDPNSLLKELESRYALGDSETDFDWTAIPSGFVVQCRIVPRSEWGSERA